jgi:hypothetical protein
MRAPLGESTVPWGTLLSRRGHYRLAAGRVKDTLRAPLCGQCHEVKGRVRVPGMV